MSDPNKTHPAEASSDWGGMSHDEAMSALFSQMIVQLSNMAMILLGKVPHPETGKTLLDLEGARMFIDQLEMLEAKTRGNLSTKELVLLRQSLVSLQMAFVEAVEAPQSSPTPKPPSPAQPAEPPAAPAKAPAPGATEEDAKKKFSKKY
jgi:hypothetical protein